MYFTIQLSHLFEATVENFTDGMTLKTLILEVSKPSPKIMQKDGGRDRIIIHLPEPFPL
jgi:hypothetical protein